MLARKLQLHIQSRTIDYPADTKGHTVQRLNVPDEKVEWTVSPAHLFMWILIQLGAVKYLFIIVAWLQLESKCTEI